MAFGKKVGHKHFDLFVTYISVLFSDLISSVLQYISQTLCKSLSLQKRTDLTSASNATFWYVLKSGLGKFGIKSKNRNPSHRVFSLVHCHQNSDI